MKGTVFIESGKNSKLYFIILFRDDKMRWYLIKNALSRRVGDVFSPKEH